MAEQDARHSNVSSIVELGDRAGGTHGGENDLNYARHSNVSSVVEVGDGTSTHGGENHSNHSRHSNASSMVEADDGGGTHGVENHSNHSSHSNSRSTVEAGDAGGTYAGENHPNHSSHPNASITMEAGDGGGTHGSENHSNHTGATTTGPQESRLARISRVRAQLRDDGDDDKIYTPQYVTIGPYHRHITPSQQAEVIKVLCVAFMETMQVRGEEGREGGGLARLMDERLVARVKECYDRDRVGDMRTRALSTLLLHDGCYLLANTCAEHYLSLWEANNPQAPPAPSNNGVDAVPSMHVTPAEEMASLLAANNSQAPSAPSNNHVDAVASMHTLTPAEEMASLRDTMFLLENQIPFVVLEKIHERVTHDGPGKLIHVLGPYVLNVLAQLKLLYISPREAEAEAGAPPDLQQPQTHLLHLVHTYLWPYVLNVLKLLYVLPREAEAEAGSGAEAEAQPNLQQQASHLLHLVHTYLTKRQQRSSTGDDNTNTNTAPNPRLPIIASTGRWRRATEYCKYGDVRFKRREFKDDGQPWTFLDVLHDGAGTLWIPRLRVDGMTWTILRNLMALEEQQEKRRPVTAYCVFMSQLACRVEDVELLQRKGILEQFLGSDEEVATGFAQLCSGVTFDVDSPGRNYLRSVWHDLHKLCCKNRRNFMGSFRQTHWSEPLVRAAFIAASFVVVLQLAQVILAIIPLAPKHK